MNYFEDFKKISRAEVDTFIDNMNESEIRKAADMIWEAYKKGNRTHITGIGKPGHVAGYVASLLSSVGIPSYFLHGTEAVHGSCGQLMPDDIVICISNSGETAEMRSTAMAIRNNGCKIIGVTGNAESWLAKFGDAHLFAGVKEEGGPLNRAPRTSILAECLVLQAVSVVLQEKRQITPEEYVLRHPGGKLGQIREGEK